MKLAHVFTHKTVRLADGTRIRYRRGTRAGAGGGGGGQRLATPVPPGLHNQPGGGRYEVVYVTEPC